MTVFEESFCEVSSLGGDPVRFALEGAEYACANPQPSNNVLHTASLAADVLPSGTTDWQRGVAFGAALIMATVIKTGRAR